MNEANEDFELFSEALENSLGSGYVDCGLVYIVSYDPHWLYSYRVEFEED